MNEAVFAMNDSMLNEPENFTQYHGRLEKHHEEKLQLQSSQAYRLLFGYSYGFGTGIYTIKKNKKGGLLTIKHRYSEEGKKAYCLPDTTITLQLTHKQWNELVEQFGSNCFWTIPSPIQNRGLDGGIWILEAFDPKANNPRHHTYAIAARWSPGQHSAFGKICHRIMVYEETLNE
ncbi:MAG: hypothetical protein AB8F95_17620 [Bacteroidia bacterium]